MKLRVFIKILQVLKIYRKNRYMYKEKKGVGKKL